MGISSAVDWWEKWQLRILVLGSLSVQWLLFLSATFRKYAIPSWFRSIIWLAYLGSDALAIYALANLFSRQRRQDCSSGQGNSILEVVWAPVLLMHLGGQDLITAYNIEDNELWTRHVLTAVSQVTVAIYVFCTSWPGSDKRLLEAAILFFVPGILKVMEKPWALRSASISNLVSSSRHAPLRTANREGGISSLEDYVRAAKAFVQVNPHRQAQEFDVMDNHLPDQAQGEDGAVDLEAVNRLPNQAQGEDDGLDLEPDLQPQTSSTWRSRLNQIRRAIRSLGNQYLDNSRSQVDDCNVDLEAYKLFVDLPSPFPDRLGILKSFWLLDEKQAYRLLQDTIFSTFDLLYTKEKMLGALEERREGDPGLLEELSGFIRILAALLPWVSIGLFHKSHRDAYNDNDVKVTYVLFCCTAALEISFRSPMMREIQKLVRSGSDVDVRHAREGKVVQWQRVLLQTLIALWEQAKGKVMQWQWGKKMIALYEWAKTNVPQYKIIEALNSGKHSLVGQYALVGFFVRNKRHTKTTCILNSFNCKDFFYQHWPMKPCNSSLAITELVLNYVKKGWEGQIEDADSYWKFNDHRGQSTLQKNRCDQDLCFSLRRPFDESVLLWHIATDLCFYYMDASAHHRCATAECIQDASGEAPGCAIWCERSPHHERAVQCRELSNYMMYLLFVNPEMLLAGTRRNLFLTANAEFEEILKDDKPLLKKILKAKKPWLKDIFKGEKQWLKDILESRDSDLWMILKGMHMEIYKAKKKWLEGIERGLVQRIISKVQRTDCREQVVEHAGSLPDAESYATTREDFVPDAWKISKVLLALGDEKMWDVIEGVWVEMLCFSASRCRAYLHAKSLGTGPELLTYVWLLLSHMGMETLPERLQRTELSSGGGNSGTTPSTSQISRVERPTSSSHLRPHEEAATADGASTSQSQEILPAE